MEIPRRIALRRLAAAIWGPILVWACSDKPPEGLPPPTSPRTVSREAQLDGVTIDRFEADRLRYRALVAHVSLNRETEVASGEIVAIDVLEKATGALKARVTAPRGRSVLRSKVLDLEGGVVIRDADGRTLRSESMHYDAANDALESKGEVQIEGDNFFATGQKLTGAPAAGRLEVVPPVVGHVEPRHALHPLPR